MHCVFLLWNAVLNVFCICIVKSLKHLDKEVIKFFSFEGHSWKVGGWRACRPRGEEFLWTADNCHWWRSSSQSKGTATLSRTVVITTICTMIIAKLTGIFIYPEQATISIQHMQLYYMSPDLTAIKLLHLDQATKCMWISYWLSLA